MNLGNKLAVGEAVDPGIDEIAPRSAAPAPAVPVPAVPVPAVPVPAVPVPAGCAPTGATEVEPVAAHAER